MSETRTTKSDDEWTANVGPNARRASNELDAGAREVSSSPVGVYDQPAGARSGTGNTLIWILVILVILFLVFLAYQWWF